MPDTNNDVADKERREPIASARAAMMGGGVVLTTLTLEGIEWVVFWDEDIGVSGCISCAKIEFDDADDDEGEED